MSNPPHEHVAPPSGPARDNEREDHEGRSEDHEGRKNEPARRRDGGPGHELRNRARHAATQGAKAAGLTAAGLAGGALLERRSKPSRKLPIPRGLRIPRSLPIPRRRSRVEAIRDQIARRLP